MCVVHEDRIIYYKMNYFWGHIGILSAIISSMANGRLLLLTDTPPFFVNDVMIVSAYSVAIDDATDLHSSVIIIQAKDADDNVTLRVSMETESFYFQFNETSSEFVNILSAQTILNLHLFV